MAAASTPPLLEAAADKLRGSAKWLIAAFGAIGAAIATGLQFSDLGSLEGDAQRWAVVGVVLAFAGIGLAVYGVAQLLVPRARTLTELAGTGAKDPARKFFERSPEVLTPFETLEELRDARGESLARYRRAFQAWRTDPTEFASRELDNAEVAGRPIEEVAGRVEDWANFVSLSARYRKTMRLQVLPGLALAVLGSVLLALYLTDTPEPQPASTSSAQLGPAPHQSWAGWRAERPGAATRPGPSSLGVSS